MNDRPFQDLLNAYLDGEISDGGFDSLQELIRTSDAARQLFVEQTHMHRQLHDLVPLVSAGDGESDRRAARKEPSRSPSSSAGRFVSRVIQHARRPTPASLTVSLLVMCAIISAMAFVVVPFYQGDGEHAAGPNGFSGHVFVAVLSSSQDAVWVSENSGGHLGARLAPGQRVALKAGLAEITFRKGAKVLVQGPAEFIVENDNGGQLLSGKIVAKVPASAVGFTATTPSARVVDLGTEFGLEVRSASVAELLVFEGAVSARVRLPDGQWGDAKTIQAGEAVRIDARDRTLVAFAGDASSFQRQISPPSLDMGSPLVARTNVDTAAGVTLICGEVVGHSGVGETFSFYSEQPGRWISPLIFTWDQDRSEYRCTGIGQSIASDGSGRQSAPFVPLAGTAELRKGVSTFGFFDGRVVAEPGGDVRTVSTNPGVVSADLQDGPWMFAFEEQPRHVQIDRTYTLGEGSDEHLTLGRTYSARLKIRIVEGAAQK